MANPISVTITKAGYELCANEYKLERRRITVQSNLPLFGGRCGAKVFTVPTNAMDSVVQDFDFGKAKAFPLRDQHFFTSIDKAMTDLDWKPEFGLIEGLTDSYTKDFGRGTFRKPADFTTDDMILSKLK
eukprot:1139466-Pelagomonas_calceolata.AAC.4